jgi:hypothetical protein
MLVSRSTKVVEITQCVKNSEISILKLLFVCLFVWGPVSGCTAACRLIVHTPCVFNIPTFTARRLYVTTKLDFLAAKGNLAESSEFHATLGIFYMPQFYDMGQTTLLPLRRKSC